MVQWSLKDDSGVLMEDVQIEGALGPANYPTSKAAKLFPVLLKRDIFSLCQHSVETKEQN